MPSGPPGRFPWRWPVPPLYVPSEAGPDEVTLRECGCRADPAVFGHWHSFDGEHRTFRDTAPAGAA